MKNDSLNDLNREKNETPQNHFDKDNQNELISPLTKKNDISLVSNGISTIQRHVDR